MIMLIDRSNIRPLNQETLMVDTQLDINLFNEYSISQQVSLWANVGHVSKANHSILR